MPIKNRHFVRTIGAVASGEQSAEFDISSCTKGLLYLVGAAAVVNVQFSGDGGATWYLLFDRESTNLQITVVGNDVYQVDLTGSLMRITVTVADITAAWFEGVREIA
jgi:hypothetical protein